MQSNTIFETLRGYGIDPADCEFRDDDGLGLFITHKPTDSEFFASLRQGTVSR